MSEHIRKEIQRRMTLLGKNAKGLSVAAGLNPTAVRDILEERVKNPTARTLEALAKQLGCTVSDLTGETKPKSPPSAVPSDPSLAGDLPGVPEIDAILGAGSAGDGATEVWSPDGENTFSADVVRDIWGIPDSYLSGVLGTNKRRVRIIEVRGDSMEPTLEPGDRVMVDLGDRHPSPDGLFGLWDGLGVVVKRLEHIPYSDPTRFRIISDNTERHSSYERLGEEMNIIGRVIWLARKM